MDFQWTLSTYYKKERVFIGRDGEISSEKEAAILTNREDAVIEAQKRRRLYLIKKGLDSGRFYFGSKGYDTLECWSGKMNLKKEQLLEK